MLPRLGVRAEKQERESISVSPTQPLRFGRQIQTADRGSRGEDQTSNQDLGRKECCTVLKYHV